VVTESKCLINAVTAEVDLGEGNFTGLPTNRELAPRPLAKALIPRFKPSANGSVRSRIDRFIRRPTRDASRRLR
jgi:hypothetical protein